jgi:hypothetical protein
MTAVRRLGRHNRKFNGDKANRLLGGNPDLREIAI